MKKIWSIIVCILLLIMAGCNYDAENSKKILAVSPDEHVKTVADEFFSSNNLDTTDFKKINNTIAYLAKAYAAYPNSVTGRPSIYLLIQDVKTMIRGDINVLPTIINGFKNETGVYYANTDSQKWMRTATAEDSIVMNFKDQYNQNRQAIMTWKNTLGSPLRLTFIRKSGTVTVDLPNKIIFKLSNLSSTNDSALTIDMEITPNQSFSQVDIKNTASYLDYTFKNNAVIKDTAVHLACTLDKSDRQLAQYNLDGNGSYLLRGFIDRVDYQLTFGAYNSKLNILDKLYMTDNVKDANTLKDYLLSNSGIGTYDYIKGICDIVNKNINFRVWNASNDLLCAVTMYPIKLNGSYTGAPYINWIYGDSQDLSDFSNAGIKNAVSKLQQILQYINNLFGQNS